MFGPDGKPIQLHANAPIIGAPKGLDDVPAFNDETIDELIKGMEAMVAQGTPLEVPAAMPIGQLAGMARTLRDFRARIKVLEDELAGRRKDPVTEEPPLLDLTQLKP